ncbi:MAG: hypothetical protein Q8P18_16965 [Pseudomonadota bacterium]|nr:hypothetical protein [Pseudomonadota bacterium]
MLLPFLLLLLPSAFAAEPTITLGPVAALPSLTTVPTEGLSVAMCAATPVAPTDPQSGTLVFEVRLRRGQVSLVSVMSADSAALPYQPCLERVLADYAWPVRRANLRVPVTVGTVPTVEKVELVEKVEPAGD